MATTDETFWDRVARRLDELGMTQADLSKKVGVSREMLQLYRKNGSEPRRPTLVRFAKALQVPSSYLVPGAPDEGESSMETSVERTPVYASLTEFLAVTMMLEDERNFLRSLQFAHGDPGFEAWEEFLRAYRATKRGKAVEGPERPAPNIEGKLIPVRPRKR